MEITKWDSILDLYKFSLIKLFYNIVIEKIPKTISDLVTWRHGPYKPKRTPKSGCPTIFNVVFKELNPVQRCSLMEFCVKLF